MPTAASFALTDWLSLPPAHLALPLFLGFTSKRTSSFSTQTLLQGTPNYCAREATQWEGRAVIRGNAVTHRRVLEDGVPAQPSLVTYPPHGLQHRWAMQMPRNKS